MGITEHTYITLEQPALNQVFIKSISDHHKNFIWHRLAFDNIGVVDWNPWIPKIFTRFMRSFNLPTAGHLNLTGKLKDSDASLH